VDKIKVWWSTFSRCFAGAVRTAGSTVGSIVSRKDAPSTAEVRLARTHYEPSGRDRSGDYWMLKEPKWFAAILALGFVGFLEVLSRETADWPPCLVVSKYSPPAGQAGQETCATLSEGIMQFLGFLWDHADHNAVTAFAALTVAMFAWMLWRSSEKMWRVTNLAANAAKQSADALVAAEQAQLLTIVEVSNIPHILGELGKHDHPGSREIAVGERASVQYILKNYGKTPAVLKEISHELQHWNHPPDQLRYFPVRTMPKERAVVAGGSTEPLQCILVAPLTAEGATTIRTSDSFLWLFGRVIYDDAFGREREHRFLYRYRIGYGFQPYSYKDYNKST
jgi:hypothetical protein